MKGIMNGIRVVEVAAWTYVPIAGTVLAEWGADVLKIEHPEVGDPQRGLVNSGLVPSGPGGVNHMIELPNRGKRSVALNLKTEEGRDLLLQLAASADVFLTNFRPQARVKLGIDVDDIRAVNPNIIYVRGSALGQRGPEADRPGYDNSTFWGRGGGADIVTPPGEYPSSQPGPGFGDVIGGQIIAGGIAAALFHRERTGEAVIVDNSLLANGIWSIGATVLAADLFGFSRMPRGDRTKMPNPLVNNFKTKDDRFFSLIMLESDRFWADLVTKMGHPELADDPRYVDSVARAQNAQECCRTLDEIFASRTFEEWKPIMVTVDGATAPVQTADELLVDPQVEANGYLRDVVAASGSTFRMVPSPIQFDEEPPDLVRAPEHGEHTDEVLQELGLEMDAIIDLKIKGAIL
jgi:crotonobetainyl-CoA:carnitine CoA-transferase CaiB-like acyl-CoA transferase